MVEPNDEEAMAKATLHKLDAGLDFRRLHQIIKELERTDYMDEQIALWRDEYSERKVQELVAMNLRLQQVAASMLRHFEAEFQTEPFSGAISAMALMSFIYGLLWSTKDALIMSSFSTTMGQLLETIQTAANLEGTLGIPRAPFKIVPRKP